MAKKKLSRSNYELQELVKQAIDNLGGQAHIREIDAEVIKLGNFSAQEIEIIHTEGNSQTELEYRLAWSRTELRDGGVLKRVEGKSGTWALALPTRSESRASDADKLSYGNRPYWFLKHQKEDTKTLGEYLENGTFDTLGIFQSHVSEMEPGDSVALAKQTRVNNVPGYQIHYETQRIAMMTIYATGTYLGRDGDDSSNILIDWEPFETPRDWYIFTKTDRIWKIDHVYENWKSKNLIDFTFFGQEQLPISDFTDLNIGNLSNDDRARVEPDPIMPYGLDDILLDGCFIPEAKLEEYLEILRLKKNVILQGPPGTGKTWLAKKLGFALIGFIDQKQMTRVQFHPNLSYEDFIRGWRPVGDGKLDLADGPLMDAINSAIAEPDLPYVVVIEEINRGNPAQILGEMLTLLEFDKRTASEALKLSYPRSQSEMVYVPDNLYLVGTMNIADRSLALVDLALRRRFAFLDFEPLFNTAWLDWVQTIGGLSVEFSRDIQSRINALNTNIKNDKNLGPQFGIGHSFLTPQQAITDPGKWFRQKVETEIAPVLKEYWFDDIDIAEEKIDRLLEGL